jgi:hypothetical protein
VEDGFSRKDRASTMPELKKLLPAVVYFAFGRQVMINTSTPGGATFANTIGKLGALLFAGLQHLYAAHTEKVQMRFAPTPIYSGRASRRQRPFGL